MVKNRKDEEEDHQNKRTESTDGRSGCDSEETNEAQLRNVKTDKQLLQSARVDAAFGVDVSVIDEKQVVTVGEVKEVESDCRKDEDQWCNAGVADSCILLAS